MRGVKFTIKQEEECLNQLGQQVKGKGKGEMPHLEPLILFLLQAYPLLLLQMLQLFLVKLMVSLTLFLSRQGAQESKYTLWTYVTRKEGLRAKLGGGGNVCWSCNFCKNEFKSTYYWVKGHLLALPCGISSCKAVNNTQRRDSEKEDHVGQGKVATTSKTQQRPPPSRHGSEVDAYPTRKMTTF